MKDLVPYEPQPSVVTRPESPSPYWTIRTAEPSLQADRRGGTTEVLRVVFEHFNKAGGKIVIETTVDRAYNLHRLVPFLDAAVDLPDGIRVKISTLEPQPWDGTKPPRRWTEY